MRKNIVASSVRNERRLKELMVELKKLNIRKMLKLLDKEQTAEKKIERIDQESQSHPVYQTRISTFFTTKSIGIITMV